MGKRILILSNHFITLYNFRKEFVQRLIDEGHVVFISIPGSIENKFFYEMGCRIMNTPVERRGVNPAKDIGLIFKYIKIMNYVKPDIVFSYTIKPNIYGSIASNITKNRQVNNITGTGSTFLRKSFVSEIAKLLYKISIKNAYKVFFQNSGDRELFVKYRLVKDNYEILPGSGVNLNYFQVSNLPPENQINFIFIGRVMKLKGIDQYLEAAKAIKTEYRNTNFFIAGFNEEEKYKAIIKKYSTAGFVRYIGFQKDIKAWIERCHCTILPSHGGEGIPNVLLESAAMGRVCIASNINGSRDVIEDGVTGYLFGAGDARDLTDKIKQFLKMELQDKVKMGLAGRAKVEKEFDRQIVISKYLEEININDLDNERRKWL